MPSANTPLAATSPRLTSAARAARTVAIAGNPNSGKTTLFNALTGLRQKVGNYPGVTVEKKVGRFFGAHGDPFDLLDLPGTYSLQTRSPDEAVARDVLLGRRAETAAPDLLLCVVDAANLERNLYLVAQLAELGLPLVVALNMMDLAERNGLVTDPAALSARLGCPVVPIVASQKRGLVELKHAIVAHLDGAPPRRAPLPEPLETAARPLAEALARERVVATRFAMAEALLLLSAVDDELVAALPGALPATVEFARTQIERAGIDRLSAAVQSRYAWAAELAAATQHANDAGRATASDRLDTWLTHRLWGWVFFLGVMAVMFFTIFRVAEIPMDWIEAGQVVVSDWAASAIPAGDFRDLVVDGVIAGVGGVVIFLPQILILFFFIGLLEDTGYMARAAFIVDRLMSRVGLHGKSFVPMLSSFACAIPGIMAARTIDNTRDRLVTILVAPLVSCSARLPVYALLIALFLPAGGAWRKAGMMLALYALGLTAAFAMAWLLRRTLFKGERSLLLLEMPPYRRPSLRATALRMWERAVMFLKRAGTAILAISIVIWALSTYPKPEHSDATAAEALATSCAGRLGHAIEPVIQPLGYDWKIGVGIISSFAAREVFVGTMSIIYAVENGEEDTDSLRDRMLAETRPDGSPVYTPLVVFGLMVFYVLAMQCLPTSAVVRRETGSWKWPLFQLAYMTALAWSAAFLVYQGGRLLGFS
ncbi:MAG TPA: ferrous iron transport protein B [Opitutaceae bacterium]|nr:ferrous iron transport protein B [Opitutaceae bacterium]